MKNESFTPASIPALPIRLPRYLFVPLVCFSIGVLAQNQVSTNRTGNPVLNTQPPIRVADEQTTVLERGTHHNVIQYSRKVADTNGVWRTVVSKYTQLENGLNRQDERGLWTPAPAVLEITTDGAQFVGAEWIAAFKAEPSAADSVVLTTGLGNQAKRYVSHVVGLAYFDKASGDSVLLTQVATNSAPGVLTSEHDLVYPSCFVGVDGDIVYHLSRSSIAQDIRLRSGLPTPGAFQLDPATTELEVLTEFVEADTPNILSSSTGTQKSGATGSPVAGKTGADGDDLGDRQIDFGLFNIGLGRAFAATGGTNDPGDGGGELVRKHWTQLSGRQVLIEALDFQKVAGWLDSLPAPRGGGALNTRPVLRREVQNRPLPPRPKRFDQAEYGNRGGMRKVLALKDSLVSGPALVLDYQSLAGGTVGNYTFTANETYYIVSVRSENEVGR